MSTITRIKGTIDNNNLPILTSEGLVPYWYGNFCNLMEDAGYTLSTNQKNAVKAFVESLSEADIIGKVISMFPFVGNTETPNAAKVPIIGETMFEFADGFDGFLLSDTEIQGINKIPGGALVFSDISTEHCFNIGLSFIKEDTADLSTNQLFLRFYKKIDNVDTFNYYVQYSSDNRLRIVYTPSGSAIGFQNKIAQMSDEGNVYMLGGLGDETSEKIYNRYAQINSSWYDAAAADDTTRRYQYDTNFASATLATNNINTNVFRGITSLTFFNDILTKQEAVVYMQSLKTLMQALGKEVIQ
jgi:hypothetical protein